MRESKNTRENPTQGYTPSAAPRILPQNRAMTDAYELAAAQYVYWLADALARADCNPDDRSAAAGAILCRAYELATPDLRPQNRARVFWDES